MIVKNSQVAWLILWTTGQQFVKPHWKLCVITILLLIIDVAGALFIPTLAAQMLNQGTSGASFDALLNY